ncbi:MAG: cysteine--tRNA ligase [Acidimicrobiia bacterium]
MTSDAPHIRIYDTLVGDVVDLQPREAGKVAMYACGPTVYDHPHLGHGRTAMNYDMMRRYLEWRGFGVQLAMNVTDIDDKIIARADAEGTSESEVAGHWEAIYWQELERLGVRRPTYIPHATEYVAKMLELIGRLVDAGVAYNVPGSGVYFSVAAYAGYGALSHRTLADLRESAGSRVEVDEDKREPIDFALWKAAKPGEPTWGSPWGPGRPGWHIECSAMSLDLLGEGFDIHGGGSDLVFPHHENERAQAEAAGAAFARHWVHTGMLNISGEKMSKSLGNFVTLADAINVHGPRALRLLALQHHYRAQMEASEATLTAAKAALDRIDGLMRRGVNAGIDVETIADARMLEAFAAAVDIDFDTPAGLAVIFDALRRANTAFDEDRVAEAAPLVTAIRQCLEALGLPLLEGAESDDAIDALVAARNAARAAKDFAEADRIRDDLAAQGITIEDTASGTVWHR